MSYTASPPTAPLQLHILVIGAGIGGLSAAHALVEAGHRVTVLESAEELGEVGAGINLGPNTTRLLFGWGLGSEIGRLGTQPECFWYRKSTTGEPIGYQLWGKTLERETGAPLVQFHRADLHNMLFGLLKDSSSVQIRLGSKVLSVDPNAPSATLASGEIVHGDVIIAADGGRSRIRDLVIGQPTPVYPTGQAAFRGLIPLELALADPELRPIYEKRELNVWIGPHRSLVTYRVRGGSLINFVALHPDNGAVESWKATGEVSEMIAEFAGFDPRCARLLSLAPSCMKWRLVDREPLVTWVHPSGKVALLGDACHPMLPFRAQGAAMAIEDGALLGRLFTHIGSLAHVAPLLKAYEKLRLPRATDAQLGSRAARDFHHMPEGDAQIARDAKLKIAMEAELARTKAAESLASEIEKGPAKFAHDASNQFSDDVRVQAEAWWNEEGRALLVALDNTEIN